MPHCTNTVPVRLAKRATRVNASETRTNDVQNANKVTHVGELERPWAESQEGVTENTTAPWQRGTSA
eukprot:1191704-Rhodomonas_salina.2